MPPADTTVLQQLAERQMVMVTGKGGVGKSALSAALARQLSELGRRVLVIEIDPRESVHQMLGVQPSGGELLTVRPRLHLQNLQPRRVLDQLVSSQVHIEWLADRVRRSPVYQHFVEGAPGLKELAVLGQTTLLLRGAAPGYPPVDMVILDAPATGHGVSLLAAPLLVADVIQHGPFGRMTAEVADLVSDPQRCGVVVVTLAEEMPVTEALELRAMLEQRTARRPELLVINGLYPVFPSGATTSGDALRDLWQDRRRVNERELARLATHWQGPRLELPLFPLERGPRLIDALTALLGAAPACLEVGA